MNYFALFTFAIVAVFFTSCRPDNKEKIIGLWKPVPENREKFTHTNLCAVFSCWDVLSYPVYDNADLEFTSVGKMIETFKGKDDIYDGKHFHSIEKSGENLFDYTVSSDEMEITFKKRPTSRGLKNSYRISFLKDTLILRLKVDNDEANRIAKIITDDGNWTDQDELIKELIREAKSLEYKFYKIR